MFVGFMRKSKSPSFMAKFIAITCKNQGIELIYMTPEDVNIKSNTVNGYIYLNNEWEKVTVPIPSFIDISPHLFTYKKYKKILNYLKKNTKLSIDERHIILKDELQFQLRKNKDFYHIAIPTKKLNAFSDLTKWLDKYKTIVVKPVRGLQGNDVYILKKEELNNYTLGISKEEKKLTENELSEYFSRKLKNKNYIIQKYISSRTIDGDPFDCRIHLEKNGKGEWETARKYIRIGIGQKVVSNISQGGAISKPENFLQYNFGEEKGKEIDYKLDLLAQTLPYEIEKIKNKTFMTMGVDVGIDNSGDLFVFEINSFPIVSPLKTEIALLRADYYKYMLNYPINNKENEQLKKELTNIKNSKSWKLTKPLRKLGIILNKKSIKY